jgi:hypothetical protein
MNVEPSVRVQFIGRRLTDCGSWAVWPHSLNSRRRLINALEEEVREALGLLRDSVLADEGSDQ